MDFERIGILTTYSHIFNIKKPKNEIVELIKQIPLLSYYIVLSQISTGVYGEEELKKDFEKMYLGIIARNLDGEKKEQNPTVKNVYKDYLNGMEKIKNSFAFSPQSILSLWKWLLAFGDNGRLDFLQEREVTVPALCYLSMLVNDYLYEGERSKEEVYAELFSNMVFNHEENVLHEIARTFLIYTDIAEERDLFGKAFLNINKDFYDKYGYTIKQYVAILFGIYACFLQPKVLGAKWLQNIDEIFSESKLKDIAKEIILSLSVNINTMSAWSKEKIDLAWNFQQFREKPLLMINDKEFLPFSLKILQEQLFTGLYHRVRHIYPEDNKAFNDFYGKPFEIYTQMLLKKSTDQTILPYEVIPEFRYKKTNDSPDIMLRLGNTLLAIEVKSYRLRLPSITEADVQMIDKDLYKMVINPLKQVHDRVMELMDSNHESIIGIRNVYLMVVTQGHFPTLKPYEIRINEELTNHFKIAVEGYYHLDIEEFEMLCHLIERKRPIFKVLNNKNTVDNQLLPFKNFILDKKNSYHVKPNKFISEQFSTVVNEIGTMLFNKMIKD